MFLILSILGSDVFQSVQVTLKLKPIQKVCLGITRSRQTKAGWELYPLYDMTGVR